MKVSPQRSVCFVCYRLYPDTNFENYSHFVSEGGYRVTIVAYLGAGQKEHENIGKTKVVRIPLPSTNRVRIKWYVFATGVIKFLKRNNFEIVHIHNTCPYFLLYKLLTNRHSKFVYHNTSYPVSTTRFGAYKRMLIEYIQAFFMDRLIVQSEELKAQLIGIRKHHKTEVIPIGFNPRIFHLAENEKKISIRQRLGINDDNQVLVYIGSMARFRQLDRLVKGFARVCKTHDNARLLMVGDGSGLQDIISLAKKLKIDQYITFTGLVRHDEVVHYIHAADIGISYVPINENYTYNPPLKTYEYLACGLPVIATMTVSNCRIIQNRINGFLARDNEHELSSVIIDLLNDFGRLQFLKKNARKSVDGNDFKSITQNHLLPLYSRLLA